jgi:hypothetical protein
LATISFKCFNSSPFTPLKIVFEGLKANDMDPTDKHHQKMQKDFFWAGSTRLKLELGAEQSSNFHIQVAFANPGRYNINRFKFTVQNAATAQKAKKVTVYSSSQHFISVMPKVKL